MNKIALVSFLFVILSLGMPLYAQQDCGAVDCPGRCGRFVDANGDGFCDHGYLSAPAKVENNQPATPSVEKDVAAKPEPAKTNKTKNTQHNTVAEVDQKEIADTSSEVPAEEIDNATDTTEPADKPVKNKSPYSLILISLITLGLYMVTAILVKTNVMKKITHRRIWNVVLLVTALVSCLLGFFLVIQINYNLKMDWLWTVKYYHVQFGIAMTIVAVIHILWHIPYYKSIFSKK